MGFMHEFPHSRTFDSDLREIIEMYFTVKELPDKWVAFEKLVSGEVEDLKNFVNKYFDNLNVQNEINNKLDAMAIDGSLSALIQSIFNACFVTLEMFGGKSDDINFDNAQALRDAVRYANTNNVFVYIFPKTYYFKTPVEIPYDTFVLKGSSKIGSETNKAMSSFIYIGEENTTFITFGTGNKVDISYIHFISDSYNIEEDRKTIVSGIYNEEWITENILSNNVNCIETKSSNQNIHDCKFYKWSGYCIITKYYCEHYNNAFYRCKTAHKVTSSDNYIHNERCYYIGKFAEIAGGGLNKISDISVDSCKDVCISAQNSNQLSIINCRFDYINKSFIHLKASGNSFISNIMGRACICAIGCDKEVLTDEQKNNACEYLFDEVSAGNVLHCNFNKKIGIDGTIERNIPLYFVGFDGPTRTYPISIKANDNSFTNIIDETNCFDYFHIALDTAAAHFELTYNGSMYTFNPLRLPEVNSKYFADVLQNGVYYGSRWGLPKPVSVGNICLYNDSIYLATGKTQEDWKKISVDA